MNAALAVPTSARLHGMFPAGVAIGVEGEASDAQLIPERLPAVKKSLVALANGANVVNSLVAMLFGGINLWIKRRREAKNPDLYGSRIRPDDFDNEKKF